MQYPKYHTADLGSLKFLVTGGAGFIGSHIVEYLLLHHAAKVRVMDNLSTGSEANLETFRYHPSFEFIQGDIRDAGICRQAVKGMDYVSHQAALGSVPRSVTDPVTTNAVNIGGFLNMLVAARDEGVSRMVYAASSSTYGDHQELPKVEHRTGEPLSPYAITKKVNELYASVFSSLYGFHTIGLRYFNVFGPRQNPQGPYAAVIPLYIQAALLNEPAIIFGTGDTSRDFTYVANAVQANIKAMLLPELKSHEVVNIALGESTSLLQLWDYICAITGCNIPPVFRQARKGDVLHSLASIDKANRLIGYDPQIRIRHGLKMAVDWYKEALHPAR
ncbi:SDR family oxidoreductase [Pseudoflavitalea rhizosphaerae]|uniref:SDR family oxidoreductase n=1 Tax=Pseudoflavitalea rhizosphaerae TaxID=1884793 RepID=UPI000F8D60BD|nr:SDR family oxidoreductase [Pseudoflavitalea rhizosphaerae]